MRESRRKKVRMMVAFEWKKQMIKKQIVPKRNNINKESKERGFKSYFDIRDE